MTKEPTREYGIAVVITMQVTLAGANHQLGTKEGLDALLRQVEETITQYGASIRRDALADVKAAADKADEDLNRIVRS